MIQPCEVKNMFNMQIILGHLGQEPEMRYTPAGHPVTTFPVASNFSYTKDNQKVKETEWFTVQTWNTLAEICNQWLKKGSLVLIVGRTKTNAWNGDDGQKHTAKIVVADRVVFVDLKNGDAVQQELEPSAEEEAAQPNDGEPQ